MTRQRFSPLLIPAGGGAAIRLQPVSLDGPDGGVPEASIRDYIHAQPSCLPLPEIDPMYRDAVAVCTELQTLAGRIDNFMVTPAGLPVIVECKLWRNPQARREVVGQILDYAKELSRWSSSDLQRAVRQRLSCGGDPVLERVRAVAPDIDEIGFNDALTHNLRRGRFLLLIVGDGIREGVEAISEYLQAHTGLHFSLGLVELPMFDLPDGSRLVVPRVLARTYVVTRNVVALPDGYSLEAPDELPAVAANPASTSAVEPISAEPTESQQFWQGFLNQLTLDDPEQRIPPAARLGPLSFMMPAPGGASWLNVFRNKKPGELGVELSSSGNGVGAYVRTAIADEWQSVKPEVGGTSYLTERDGRPVIGDRRAFPNLDDPDVRQQAYRWLAERVNTFVNVIRPRVRSAALDYEQRQE